MPKPPPRTKPILLPAVLTSDIEEVQQETRHRIEDESYTENSVYSLGTPEPDRMRKGFPWIAVALCLSLVSLIFLFIVYLMQS